MDKISDVGPRYWFFVDGEWKEIPYDEYWHLATRQSSYRNLSVTHVQNRDYEDYQDVHP